MKTNRFQSTKRTVLQIIHDNEAIGRAQIAGMAKLSIPTVMKLTDEFIQRGLVREIGRGESTGGKPPVLLEFDASACYSIGVDLGATKTICVLMDAQSVITRISFPTNFEKGPQAVLDKVGDAIEGMLVSSNIDRKNLIGICLGVPGLLDKHTQKVLFSPDIGWTAVDAKKIFSERFKVHVSVENTTRVIAYGEKLYGIAKDCSDYMCINLGYGIGGAFVFQNQVYGGASGTAGEFGHLTAIPNGPLCDCGDKGCLEAVASGRAIARDAREMLRSGVQSNLHEMVGGNYELVEAKTVYDAAKCGDKVSLDIVMNAIEHIGTAIAGMINLLDLKLIILEGAITRSGNILMDNLQRSIDSHRMPFAGRNARVAISTLGDEATAIGAASKIIDWFLDNVGEMDG